MASTKHRTNPASPVALHSPRDDVDRALLALLQTDARQSTADLARHLGVARTTVVARLSRLSVTG